jgi:hypothetical protein
LILLWFSVHILIYRVIIHNFCLDPKPSCIGIAVDILQWID